MRSAPDGHRVRRDAQTLIGVVVVDEAAHVGDEIEGLGATGVDRARDRHRAARLDPHGAARVDIADDADRSRGREEHQLRVIRGRRSATLVGSGRTGVLDHAENLEVGARRGLDDDTAVRLHPPVVLGDNHRTRARRQRDVRIGAIDVIAQRANRAVDDDVVESLDADDLADAVVASRTHPAGRRDRDAGLTGDLGAGRRPVRLDATGQDHLTFRDGEATDRQRFVCVEDDVAVELVQ